MTEQKRKAKRNNFTLSKEAQAKIDKIKPYQKSKIVSRLIEDNL